MQLQHVLNKLSLIAVTLACLSISTNDAMPIGVVKPSWSVSSFNPAQARSPRAFEPKAAVESIKHSFVPASGGPMHIAKLVATDAIKPVEAPVNLNTIKPFKLMKALTAINGLTEINAKCLNFANLVADMINSAKPLDQEHAESRIETATQVLQNLREAMDTNQSLVSLSNRDKLLDFVEGCHNELNGILPPLGPSPWLFSQLPKNVLSQARYEASKIDENLLACKSFTEKTLGYFGEPKLKSQIEKLTNNLLFIRQMKDAFEGDDQKTQLIQKFLGCDSLFKDVIDGMRSSVIEKVKPIRAPQYDPIVTQKVRIH